MTILAVDNDPDRLWDLVENLRQVFVNDTVEYTHDPLMAGKFGMNHTVDLLFAGYQMKRMDGMALGNLIRRKNPDARVFLMSSRKEAEKYHIYDGEIAGHLSCPATASALREIAAQTLSDRKKEDVRRVT